MSTSTAAPPNFSRPLSSTAPHPQSTGHSLRSASSSNPSSASSSSQPPPPPPLPTDSYFNPADSLVPEAAGSASGSAPPSSPHVSRARQSKTAGTTGLGIGRPEKEKPRGGGFGAPGTGTAARGPSRKRSRVDLAGEAREERDREAGAGRLVPQDEKAGFANAIEFDPEQDGEDDEDDDEGGGKKSRTASGAANARRKIQISYIEDKARRHITFSKRKAGIMKKAFELSTLTGTQVLLLVVSETGLVYTFTTSKLQPIVTQDAGKDLIQSCLNAELGENPDGSPAGPGGMTGGRAAQAGGSGAAIQHKDEPYTSHAGDYSHIPIPPVPEPADSPESEDPVTPPTSRSPSSNRRPSAALPRRGRTVSTAVPKSKKPDRLPGGGGGFDGSNHQQHDTGAEALTDVEREILEADKREEMRLRGMEFGGGDDDDLDDQDLLDSGMGMGGGSSRAVSGMHGITATPRIASHHHQHHQQHLAPSSSSLYSSSLPQSNLGGLGQYDDYSAHELMPSVGKLEGEDEESMQAYLSVNGHQHLHHQPPSHHHYGGGQYGGAFSPHQTLSPTSTTAGGGYEGYGGGAGGGAFGGQGGAGW